MAKETYKLILGDVTFDDDFFLYNNLRMPYKKMYLNASSELSSLIEDCNNLEKFISRISDMYGRYLDDSVNLTLERLYKFGIKHMDYKSFVCKYNYILEFQDMIGDMEDAYNQITQESLRLKYNRQIDKAFRYKERMHLDNWASVALKNATRSVAHGIVDAGKAGLDEGKIKIMKTNFLNDCKKLYKFNYLMENLIMGCFDGLIMELIRLGGFNSIPVDKNAAYALYKNTVQYENNTSTAIKNIEEAIQLYPYEPKFYEHLFGKDGYNKGLLDLVKRVGLSDDKQILSYIKAGQEYIYKIRGFNGVIYDSTSERDKYRNKFISDYKNAVRECRNLIPNNIDLTNYYNEEQFKIVNKICRNCSEDYKINLKVETRKILGQDKQNYDSDLKQILKTELDFLKKVDKFLTIHRKSKSVILFKKAFDDLEKHISHENINFANNYDFNEYKLVEKILEDNKSKFEIDIIEEYKKILSKIKNTSKDKDFPEYNTGADLKKDLHYELEYLSKLETYIIKNKEIIQFDSNGNSKSDIDITIDGKKKKDIPTIWEIVVEFIVGLFLLSRESTILEIIGFIVFVVGITSAYALIKFNIKRKKRVKEIEDLHKEYFNKM